MPGPFVEHQLGAEQDANSQAAMLDDIEARALWGEPGILEKARLLREKVFVVNGLVATDSNQKCFVGELARSRDRSRAEHCCGHPEEMCNGPFMSLNGGRGQTGVEGFPAGDPWAKRHFVQHGDVRPIILDTVKEVSPSGVVKGEAVRELADGKFQKVLQGPG